MTQDNEALHPPYEPVFPDLNYEPASAWTTGYLSSLFEQIKYRPSRRSRHEVHRLLLGILEAALTCEGRAHHFVTLPTGPGYYKRQASTLSDQVPRTLRKKLQAAGFISESKRYRYDDWGGGSCTLFATNIPGIDEYSTNGRVMVDSRSMATVDNKSGRKIKDPLLTQVNNVIRIGDVWYGEGRIGLAGVNRRFSDYKQKRGGRFYGAYTNRKKDERLASMSIGGEPVAEVDISNCYLRLLAAMTGGEIPDGDLYVDLPGHRKVAKVLLVEMIGSGDATKGSISRSNIAKLRENHGLVVKSAQPGLARAILSAYPFLSALQKGVLDGEALAFHESEIVARTIINCHQAYGIHSCPMHDCVITKATDAERIKEVLEQTFYDYCSDNGWSRTPFRVGIEYYERR